MKYIIPLLWMLAVFAFQSCGQSNSNKTDTTDTEQQEMYDEIPDHAEDEMGMSHEEYLETYKDESYTIKGGEKGGVYSLVSLEDGAYPQATLAAVRHDATDTSYFNMMLEGGFSGLNYNKLMELQPNKPYIYIVYAEEVVNYPNGVFAKGTASNIEGKKATGKLIARREEKGGDLPGHFYVEQADGNLLMLTDFWEEGLLKMNGKQVIVYYHPESKKELKYVNVLEE